LTPELPPGHLLANLPGTPFVAPARSFPDHRRLSFRTSWRTCFVAPEHRLRNIPVNVFRSASGSSSEPPDARRSLRQRIAFRTSRRTSFVAPAHPFGASKSPPREAPTIAPTCSWKMSQALLLSARVISTSGLRFPSAFMVSRRDEAFRRRFAFWNAWFVAAGAASTRRPMQRRSAARTCSACGLRAHARLAAELSPPSPIGPPISTHLHRGRVWPLARLVSRWRTAPNRALRSATFQSGAPHPIAPR